MSYLLFLDESGHDHKKVPYEIHGGITLHAKKLWAFVQAIRALEQSCFGDALHNYGSEIKGMKLLDKDRFKWASQAETLDDVSRRRHATSFLVKGRQKEAPRKIEFTAYGQACLKMAQGLFSILNAHDAKIFAVAIPRGVKKPATVEAQEYLRKDLVFLLQRFFYLVDSEDEAGLLVMDETEKLDDRRLVRRLEQYFTRTSKGQDRASRIVPSPFFVSSDMDYPIQVADVCIYALNWGFRIPALGMDAPVRKEIADEFAGWIGRLQFKSGLVLNEDGEERLLDLFSIVYVADPYTKRT
jgi:hypothetical protein